MRTAIRGHRAYAAGGRSRAWLLVGIAVVAAVSFIILTVAVSSGRPLAIDAHAFEIAEDLRATWLDRAAKLITTLGLFAIVGPAVLLGAAVMVRAGHAARAVVIVVGVGLAWLCTTITKSAVDRPRPPAPLVHTTGASFPSGHAANSVGWLALALAISVTIPARGGRIAVIAAGGLFAIVVGLSRIYLRAHYATDVLSGEALAAAVYALVAICALMLRGRRAASRRPGPPWLDA